MDEYEETMTRAAERALQMGEMAASQAQAQLPWWLNFSMEHPLLSSVIYLALVGVVLSCAFWGITYLIYVFILRDRVKDFCNTSLRTWMREMRFEEMPEEKVRVVGKAVTDELIRRGILK